jgi:hypothetical protein
MVKKCWLNVLTIPKTQEGWGLRNYSSEGHWRFNEKVSMKEEMTGKQTAKDWGARSQGERGQDIPPLYSKTCNYQAETKHPQCKTLTMQPWTFISELHITSLNFCDSEWIPWQCLICYGKCLIAVCVVGIYLNVSRTPTDIKFYN